MHEATQKWHQLPFNLDNQIKHRAQITNLLPGVVEIARQNGIDTDDALKKFLHPSLNNLHDPFLLHDMDKLVKRVHQAAQSQEKVTIYGDYDVDGIASTTIMYETLKHLGCDVDYYIPNRFKDGYGPNKAAYKRIIDNGTTLLITVDNGIAGIDEIAYAKSRGIDVIITDHHDRKPEIPNADIIVYPNFPGHKYPFLGLCGTGVAMQVARALTNQLPDAILELATLATVADIMPLTGENRDIVTYGLKALAHTNRPGLKYLMQMQSINPSVITTTDLGFKINPCLNALGRMGDASVGVQLFTTYDDVKAHSLAKFAIEINQTRKTITDKFGLEANKQAAIEHQNGAHGFVITNDHWAAGILGLIASKVTQKYNRPCVVLRYDKAKDAYIGSGRGIDGLSVLEAVEAGAQYCNHFGGHQQACGLNVKGPKIDEFKAAFDENIVAQLKAKPNVKIEPELKIAANLDITRINLTFYQQLMKLAPFGHGNPEPLFEFDNVPITGGMVMGPHNDNMKVYVKNPNIQTVGIDFKLGDRAAAMKDDLIDPQHTVSFVGPLSLNEWNGNQSLQIKITDYETK